VKIRELHKQMQDEGVRTMGLQSEGLHFASEPYYAQATIVGVVAALQTAGNTAASILNNALGEDLKASLANAGLDSSKLIKDRMLMGEFSPQDKAKLSSLSSEDQDKLMQVIESSQSQAMDQVKKDYPLFGLHETSKIAMQENHGDFVKDWSHYVTHADPPDTEKFMLKGSKYLFRTSLYAEMHIGMKDDKNENMHPAAGSSLHEVFKSLKTESKAMLDVRQKSTGDPAKDMEIVNQSAKRFLDKAAALMPELAPLMAGKDNGTALMDVVERLMTMV